MSAEAVSHNVAAFALVIWTISSASAEFIDCRNVPEETKTNVVYKLTDDKHLFIECGKDGKFVSCGYAPDEGAAKPSTTLCASEYFEVKSGEEIVVCHQWQAGTGNSISVSRLVKTRDIAAMKGHFAELKKRLDAAKAEKAAAVKAATELATKTAAMKMPAEKELATATAKARQETADETIKRLEALLAEEKAVTPWEAQMTAMKASGLKATEKKPCVV